MLKDDFTFNKKISYGDDSTIARDYEENHKKEIKKKQDGFLDSYHDYLNDKCFINKSILERKVIELEILDPNFNFFIK
ncbi:MAG: hypothetical protein KKH94_12850 [Candidatus Omnitrophica bacterium]|nr:hypothetical protein [Candidatus Omnitrophota bacterium]